MNERIALNNDTNNISVQSVQSLLDALQDAQFCLYATAQMLNKTADSITKAVEDAGIQIIQPPSNL